MELPLPPPLVRVKVLVVIVDESMSSLNVALIALAYSNPGGTAGRAGGTYGGQSGVSTS